MRSDEILTALRYSAYIGDATNFPDWDDARLLLELNDKLWAVFEDIVVKSRSGYWLQESVSTTTIAKKSYRIPQRAVSGGLESVEVATTGTGAFYTLTEISPNDTQDWEGPNNAATQGVPQVFCCIGDQIVMYPTPNLAFPLRLRYYIRPSRLVTQQSSTAGGGTVRGLITSIAGIGSRQVVVNVIPNDQDTGAGLVSGTTLIDIVHPNGWYELPLVGATQTFSGTTITIGGTADLSEIEVGDYVRAAEQTDWPCLPTDFHRCLADVSAIKVMLSIGKKDQADALSENVGNDLIRFRSLLTPRVKSEPKQTPVFLMSRGGYWPDYP